MHKRGASTQKINAVDDEKGTPLGATSSES
jgi:hypothetical protein